MQHKCWVLSKMQISYKVSRNCRDRNEESRWIANENRVDAGEGRVTLTKCSINGETPVLKPPLALCNKPGVPLGPYKRTKTMLMIRALHWRLGKQRAVASSPVASLSCKPPLMIAIKGRFKAILAARALFGAAIRSFKLSGSSNNYRTVVNMWRSSKESLAPICLSRWWMTGIPVATNRGLTKIINFFFFKIKILQSFRSFFCSRGQGRHVKVFIEFVSALV